MLIVLGVALGVLLRQRRDLDPLALDDDTPRLLGIGLGRSRLALLALAVLLTAVAVASVGVIGFVGLVAPHAALLGAILVSVADTLRRTVIAPGQLPAGLMTALVGAPYFLWLLWRSRGVPTAEGSVRRLRRS